MYIFLLLSLLLVLLLALTLPSSSFSSSSSSCRVRISNVGSGSSLYAGFGKKEAPIDDKKSPPIDGTIKCACGSLQNYDECCGKFHKGVNDVAANPVELVRSRFSALCYNIPTYMMATTHPKHKEYASEEQQSKLKLWVKSLNAFAEGYEFLDLKFNDESKDSQPSSDASEAYVSFTCNLKEKGAGKVEEMIERSLFVKEGGVWLYRDAEVQNPFKNKRSEDVKPVQRKMITTMKKGVPKSN